MTTIAPATSRADKNADRLINAACAGDAREVHHLMRLGLDPDTRDENGYPVLAFAALGGHVKAMAVLLRAGGDANIPDAEGNTPLRWAAEEGRLEAAAFLLEMGAEPDRANYFGYTPLYWANHNCKHAMSRLIKAHMDIRDGVPARDFVPHR